MVRISVVAVTVHCLFASTCLGVDDHDPGQFQHHPDVRIELFAQEPDVVDPVSLTFAANGDCYVVEMRDYPYGVGSDNEPGGTIRLLRDRDGDGRVDESKLFASGLSFPTSVMAWRDGILVLAPPEIRLLRDTSGDDRADINELVVTGLRRGVTDSNANSLRWGIDNLIHVANGGNGGTVKMPGSSQPELALGNSDFAIDIDAKTIIKTGRTGGGFGLVLDDFGNSFTTHNLDYLQQRIVPTRYIEHSPEMFSFSATENISDHGVSARIFPIVQAVTRVNHPEQAGHFSSSGGMGILQSGVFSKRLANSIFVCDVVCNIVHRDVLRYEGPVLRGGRAPEEQTSEFIASRDGAFRPVGLEQGPDGAMYLIDMQRDVIEHPDYIPEAVREKLDIRAGQDRGRIYRVVPAQRLPKLANSLSNATVQQLVDALDSPFQWHRSTAHRLLIENRYPVSRDLVRRDGLSSPSPAARARSLWILDMLGTHSGDGVFSALSDSHPGVRENAVRLFERQIEIGNEAPDILLAKLSDEDANVRFQAALSLDGIKHELKQQLLLEMLMRDKEFKWSRRAVLLSIDDEARDLLMQLWESEEFQSMRNDDAKFEILNETSNVAAATEGDDKRVFADWLREIDVSSADPSLVAALLSGLDSGWSRRPVARLTKPQFAAAANRWASGKISGFQSQLVDLISLYQIELPKQLADLFAKSRREAVDAKLDERARISAIDLLARDSNEDSYDLLINLLSNPEPTNIQRTAIASIGQMSRNDSGKRLLDVWSAMLPGIRGDVIALLLSRREHQDALLTALESGQVEFSELNLDLEQRRRLLRWSTNEIGQRAAKLFGDEEYSNRKAIVADWLERLPQTANVDEGREVFAKRCSTCHIAEEKGNRVGPDLRAMSHRSVEDLLTHILDPNMSINPNYVSCVVETLDGQIVNGLLAEETADSITLKQAEGKSQTIPRAEIGQLKTLKTSLMPEGIEKDVTPQQMRSLIAYLQEN